MTLKKKLAEGPALYGVWSCIDDPGIVQILGRAGFDFVTIDLQHGFTTFGTLNGLIDALDTTGSPVMVRVPWNQPDYIMRALDLGAEGIIVPMVSTAAEAKAIADACRYAPVGSRSFGPLWSVVRDRMIETAEGDERATCIVMIETAEGLANLDAILAVDGVDGIYIGPNDLALSLGLDRVSYTVTPILHDAMVDIITRTRAAGKSVGVDCISPEQAHHWRDHGANFTISAQDANLLRTAAQQMSAALKG